MSKPRLKKTFSSLKCSVVNLTLGVVYFVLHDVPHGTRLVIEKKILTYTISKLAQPFSLLVRIAAPYSSTWLSECGALDPALLTQ